MDIYLRTFDTLSPEEVSVWGRTQAGNEQLDSPCFRPEFAACLQKAGMPVEVAVFAEKGFPLAFFPFHRVRKGKGKPLGRSLGEFQGIVQARAFKGNAVEIVKACGLSVWDFQRVPRSQAWCQGYEQLPASSNYADLTNGFESYCETLFNRGTFEMQEADRNYRKLEREVGAVRLVLNYQHEEILTAFTRWKQDQFHGTGVPNPFAPPWVMATLRETMKEKALPFMGMCVGLYAGNQLVAAELGLRSQHVYQSSANAFDPNLVRYLPAQCLRFAFYRWAAEHGIRRIDLGQGTEEYKARLSSGEHALSEGSVAVTLGSKLIRGMGWKMRRLARYPAMQGPVRTMRNAYYRLRRLFRRG